MGWFKQRREQRAARKAAEQEAREAAELAAREARLAQFKRWDGERIEVLLQPVANAERLKAIPDGKRRKWLWCELEVIASPDGKYKGEPMLLVKRGESTLGWLRPAAFVKARELHAAVVGGVNVGTVAISKDREYDDLKATAELVLGEHDWMPYFDL